jgi:hypothetical protein
MNMNKIEEDCRKKLLAEKVDLKVEKISLVEVDSGDFEEWFDKIFGKSLNFPETACMNNDSSKIFKIEKDGYEAEDDIKNAEDFLYGKSKEHRLYDISPIFSVLCRDSFIDEGEYLFSVYY